MFRQQKGQLRDYFGSQDQGILVLRSQETLDEQKLVSFSNPVLFKITGLDFQDHESLTACSFELLQLT